MSSTYSPDLRIELIGNGEQAGNWGSTTNTNLGTLIEGAIAGYVSVSVTSANQAFTVNNGADDQARTAMIALTTTTTAVFAVYAPPVSKQYIIYNTTAYVATIYNSTVSGNTTAAGSGVAIPAGKKVQVFSNGTNFYSVDAIGLAATATTNGIAYGTGTASAPIAFTAAGTAGQVVVSTGGNTPVTGPAFGVGAATTPSAVTFSATAMAINCALSNVFTTTFTANVTVAPTFSNLIDGQTINWFITQDATGSRTITWPTSFKWAGGSSFAGVLSTSANAVDLLVATYRSSTGFWYASLSKGFA